MDEPLRQDDSLYETDFFRWTQEQAAALRRAGAERVNAPLDWENLAEEIESVGRSDRRAAESATENILIHLALLALSPARPPRAGWIDEVDTFRADLRRVLGDSPSLAAKLVEFVEAARGTARRRVERKLSAHGEAVPSERIVAFLDALSPRAVLDDAYIPDSPEPAR
jgi:hypothetical protein